jgi:PhzF family phenazine biosynthesis protein
MSAMHKVAAAHFQVVNVFTSTVFSGNPTCVVFPAKSMMHMSDEWMSKVARETAQPTTSFVDLEMGTVRMFNLHGKEMAILSGHTCLGVAAAVRARTGLAAVDLTSIYGKVSLRSEGLLYEVALPSGKGSAIETMPRATLEEALNTKGSDILQHGLVLGGKFMFAELTPEAFALLTPDIAAIRKLEAVGVFACTAGAVTQQKDYLPECAVGVLDQRTDFTVRNFVPALGIDEDIATGSIQVFLNQYYAEKLGRAPEEPMYCLQASRRGGLIRSRSADECVYVAGSCALSLQGTIPLT